MTKTSFAREPFVYEPKLDSVGAARRTRVGSRVIAFGLRVSLILLFSSAKW